MIYKRRKLFSTCIISIVIVFALLINSGFARVDMEELDHIRNAIKAKGAKWHADETSMSRLSHEERKMRLGLHVDEEAAALVSDTSEAPLATVEGAPATLDWRNNGGMTYVSTVKDQGPCGSCWAFAVAAALESQVMLGTSGTQIDLSEQTLVSCSGAGTCSGGYPTYASNYIRDVGLPVETCFPYTATDNSCANACANWQAATYKAKGWHYASATTYPQRVQDIKTALFTYGPVLATFAVYGDFFSYRSGVYSYTTGDYAGGHGVLIVGYDDVNQAFIVKNSWGTGWGEAGYFMIAYSEVGGQSHFGSTVLAYDGYGDNPPPPSTCTYTLSPVSKNFKATGGTGSFTVSTQSGCPWSAINPVTWIKATSASSGIGNNTVTYTVDPNTGAARTAAIAVEGQIHTINQLKGRAK